MYIRLHGFRCHEDASYHFNEGQLHLLQGRSGAGKSTIFQALTWCLYGSLRNVANYQNPNARMSVEVEWKGATILRQRSPNFLRLTVDGCTYEGDTAQIEINKRFTTPELWPCTSYIGQGESNPLMSASSSARMALLNAIAFGDDDPKHYQDRIQGELRRVEMETLLLEQQFGGQYKIFNDFLATHQVDISQYRSPEQIRELELQLREMRRELEVQRSAYSRATSLVGQRETLTRSIARVRSELDSTPEVDPAEVQSRAVASQRYRRYLELRSEVEAATARHARHGQVELPGRYSMADLAAAHHRQQLYLAGTSQAQQAGVEYSRESIEDRCRQLMEQIAGQQLYEALDNYVRLDSERRYLTSSLTPGVTLGTLEEARRKLQEYDLASDVRTCPYCQQGLRLIGGNLTPANRGPATGDRSSLIRAIADTERQLEIQQSLIRVEKELALNPKPTIPAGLVRQPRQKLVSQLEVLRGIKVVERPEVDPKAIENSNEWWRTREELEICERRLSQHGECPEIDLDQLKKDQDALVRRRTLVEQVRSLQLQLEEIPIPPTTPEALRDLISELSTGITKLESSISASKLTGMAVAQREQLASSRAALVALHERRGDLYRLVEVARELEVATLASIVDEINTSIADWIGTIFEDPITLRLSLFRKLKSKGTEKQQVNLTVDYHGGHLTDLHSCSGGEQERFNILLTLALHQICGTGLLIFDETLSCLDLKAKDACLELVRRLAPEAIVLVVNHEICEGKFDRIVLVGEEREKTSGEEYEYEDGRDVRGGTQPPRPTPTTG